MLKCTPAVLFSLSLISRFLPAQLAAPASTPNTPAPPTPITLTIYDRTRVNTTQWFAATPNPELYGHVDSLLRISLAQRLRHFDWQAELSQSSELFLPKDAVSSVAAQGQLGLGANYFAANGNNTEAAAAAFKTGFLRYHLRNDRDTVRLGRFEFFDGAETTPENATLLWLQNYRIAQRLIGNFGFSNGQRSFDGADAHLAGQSWDLTAMAARADQGVFNMNANPELNVDVQYLAFTRHLAQQRVQVRGFATGYHDGRTGVTKTDNRPLAVRLLDHKNIRIGTYGANATAAFPVGHNTLDLLVWGVLQNGQWGVLDHRAGAIAAEGGLRFNTVPTRPWLRGGFFRATGDNNPSDTHHNTFFSMLPTPRNYARFPFFNTMNSSEQFVQLIDKPTGKLELRTDLDFLQLTSGRDLWYQGGGAFDNKVFGYIGRPANTHGSLATLYDISADYALTKHVSLSAFYSVAFGKSVIGAIYPRDHTAQYGFFELDYRFGHTLGSRKPQP